MDNQTESLQKPVDLEPQSLPEAPRLGEEQPVANDPAAIVSETSSRSAPSGDLHIEPSYKVYKPIQSASAGPSATPDLPDAWFNHTAADVRLAHASLSGRSSALKNAPLQLKSAREATEKAKLDRWPNTTIRIRFSDRTQLERTFSSSEKIRSVYAFVRPLLRDDVKPIKFVLYQSPPKRELKVSDLAVRDLTLGQLQLAPSSILHVRFEDDYLNGSNVAAPLLPTVLEQAVDPPAPRPVVASETAAPARNSTAKNLVPGDKKVPKWFRTK